jgi:hypothetical protein
MKLKIALIALGCSLAALSGCTSSKSSPERHAYYFVSHRSDFVGGNFVSNRQENYRLNLPNFTDIYARGQQDRKSGMSESDARRPDAIRQQVARAPKPSTPLPATPAINGIMKWKIKTPCCSAMNWPEPISTAILA